MRDYTIGDDRQAVWKYKMYHKFWVFPALWLVLAMELKYVPVLMFELGWMDFIFPKLQMVGHVLLYATPLVLYYSYKRYDVPWGVITLGEESIFYQMRMMGLREKREKESLSYKDIVGVRFEEMPSVLTLNVKGRVLDLVMNKEDAENFMKELKEITDRKEGSILW